jgi:methionyl-tRNA synthetase
MRHLGLAAVFLCLGYPRTSQDSPDCGEFWDVEASDIHKISSDFIRFHKIVNPKVETLLSSKAVADVPSVLIRHQASPQVLFHAMI